MVVEKMVMEIMVGVKIMVVVMGQDMVTLVIIGDHDKAVVVVTVQRR